MKTTTAITAVAALVALLSTTAIAGQRRAIPFETIEQGRSSDYPDGVDLVIRDPATWAAVWAHLHAFDRPAPPVPDVDFSKKMVIVVTLGTQPESGPSIEVRAIEQVTLAVPAGGQTRVYVTERLRGERCFTTPDVVLPYCVVVADSAPNVTFRRKLVIRRCH